MASKAICWRIKYFIRARLDYCILFDYFVEHKYMENDVRKRLLKFSHDRVIEEMYHLLYECVNDTDDVIDDMLFKGLIATGQRDIVLRIFPDYIERSRKKALDRIYENLKFLEDNIDTGILFKYMKVNKICVPEYADVNTKKTNGMKTRSDVKQSVQFWSFIVARIENAEHFDCNTDALVQALLKTGQSLLVRVIFPEITAEFEIQH